MSTPDVGFLLACSGMQEAHIAALEREYSDALRQAVTYRLLLLTTMAIWVDEHHKLKAAEHRIRELLGATPSHPENDGD